MEPGIGFLVVSGLFVWMAGHLPGTVSAYLALPEEVNVAPLFERLPGWRWVLPRVEPGGDMTFRDRDVPREVHKLGMEQPVDMGNSVPIHEIDVFLVPGLAFDSTGARLGRGGGYYDRALAERRTDADAIGVTLNERVIESVPMGEHDQRVGWLATEGGVQQCSRRGTG